MQHVITLIPGDGIGPEVTKPTLKIIKATGVKVKWEAHLAGAEALKKHGTTITKQLMHSFEKNKIALKGPVTTPVGEGLQASTWSCVRPSISTRICDPSKIYPGLRRAIATWILSLCARIPKGFIPASSTKLFRVSWKSEDHH